MIFPPTCSAEARQPFANSLYCTVITSASLSISRPYKRYCVDLSPSPSVGRSVRKVYCSKIADWIRIPFGVVNGVGREMGVLNRVIVKGKGAVLG